MRIQVIGRPHRLAGLGDDPACRLPAPTRRSPCPSASTPSPGRAKLDVPVDDGTAWQSVDPSGPSISSDPGRRRPPRRGRASRAAAGVGRRPARRGRRHLRGAGSRLGLVLRRRAAADAHPRRGGRPRAFAAACCRSDLRTRGRPRPRAPSLLPRGRRGHRRRRPLPGLLALGRRCISRRGLAIGRHCVGADQPERAPADRHGRAAISASSRATPWRCTGRRALGSRPPAPSPSTARRSRRRSDRPHARARRRKRLRRREHVDLRPWAGDRRRAVQTRFG